MKILLTVVALFGFAGAAAACPFSMVQPSDGKTAEINLPAPIPTTGS
ncbi:MAG: hypothetical protein AAGC92_03595 [Pseudomonadota bacterium]